MKRHESLAPLSREHHSALILCQLLKHTAPDYKGLPKDPVAKAVYATNLFYTALQPHFIKEEALLLIIKNCSEKIDTLAGEILQEHAQLTAAFISLGKATDLEQALHELGENLEKHIRKEERELFPLIQQHCGTALLAEVKDLLH